MGKTGNSVHRTLSALHNLHNSMRTCFFLFAIFVMIGSGARAETVYSANITGTPGLLTVPNARMYEPGTMVLHTGVLDPYFHGVLGLQIAKPLYIGLRQTAETSSLIGQADRLYPGFDLRLRLIEESQYAPEVTLGLQSAFGHKRMAAEYIVLSKRFGDFDLTGGMGWGRLGDAGQTGNPLKALGSHFDDERIPDNEMPNDIHNWFTGDDAGLFAGIEYFPPGQIFSVKAEWRADRYTAERAASDYDAPAPWSIGLALHPYKWLDLNIGLAGTEKILGSLTLRPTLEKWPGRSTKHEATKPLRTYRTGLTLPGQMVTSAAQEDITLYATQSDAHIASTMMELSVADESLPYQLGHAARHMADHGGETVEELKITPTFMGLRGAAISLMRRDLEQALAHEQGSPQEIWRNIKFDKEKPDRIAYLPIASHSTAPRLILDSQMSLSEEDSGILHRTSLVIDERRNIGRHFLIGGALRLNIHDNLDQIEKFRPVALLPVRSDVNRFTRQLVSVDRSYLGWMMTPKTDLHVSLAAGYLEEMYAGSGGEILYRPFGKTFAVGADAWLALRRDPLMDMHLGLNGDHLLTGHINAWYEFPDRDLTIQARVGRYLAEDFGGTLSLEKRMRNGIRISAFATATDNADFDPFGGTTHLYSGIKMSMPLGNIPHVPQGSEARIAVMPFGRDTGQAIDHPLPLYEMTERFSMRHISAHWNDVVD